MSDLDKIKQIILDKQKYYDTISQDEFDFGVLYICDILLAEIKLLENRKEKSK